MKSQESKIVELSDQVTKLAHVNLKLNADNKLLKAGQDELKSELAMIKSGMQQTSKQ